MKETRKVDPLLSDYLSFVDQVDCEVEECLQMYIGEVLVCP